MTQSESLVKISTLLSRRAWQLVLMLVPLFALLGPAAAEAWACPFCGTPQLTFGQQIETADVAVVVELVTKPDLEELGGRELIKPADALAAMAEFKVLKVLKGEKHLEGTTHFRAVYLDNAKPGAKCLALGADPKRMVWGPIIEINERVEKYLQQVLRLPKKGPQRLAFFLDYLEDEDSVLQRDAYDEFAAAPYDTVKEIKAALPREKLLRWIQDPLVSRSNRRLYLTLLGVCGRAQDADLLERMIRVQFSHQKQLMDSLAAMRLVSAGTQGHPLAELAFLQQAELVERSVQSQHDGLDAMIACYLTLGGESKLEVIDELFLKNKSASYLEIYSAVLAIRILGENFKTIPKKRLAKTLHSVLERIEFADLVIVDLARWGDWSVTDRLVRMFLEVPKGFEYVRVPIARYLMACPNPEAKQHLKRLAEVDPRSVKNAMNAFGFAVGRGNPAAKKNPPEKPEKQKEQQTENKQPPATIRPDEASPSVRAKSASEDSTQSPPAEDNTLATSEINESSPGKATAAVEPASSISAAKKTGATSTGKNTQQNTQQTERGYPALLAAKVVGIAVGCGALLMLLMWVILRRPSEPLSA